MINAVFFAENTEFYKKNLVETLAIMNFTYYVCRTNP